MVIRYKILVSWKVYKISGDFMEKARFYKG